MLLDENLIDDNVTLVLHEYLRTCIAVKDLGNAEAIARAIAYHLDMDYDEITKEPNQTGEYTRTWV